jgi:hypothetical protein
MSSNKRKRKRDSDSEEDSEEEDSENEEQQHHSLHNDDDHDHKQAVSTFESLVGCFDEQGCGYNTYNKTEEKLVQELVNQAPGYRKCPKCSSTKIRPAKHMCHRSECGPIVPRKCANGHVYWAGNFEKVPKLSPFFTKRDGCLTRTSGELIPKVLGKDLMRIYHIKMTETLQTGVDERIKEIQEFKKQVTEFQQKVKSGKKARVEKEDDDDG